MQYLYYLVIAFVGLLPATSNAAIINVQKDEKEFGDWKVFCENDVMIDVVSCKIASKFYENKAVISLDPSSKLANQMILVIPNIQIGNRVAIRIDKNDVIFSNQISGKDFGMIPLSPVQKSMILNQMKRGDFLFLRFNMTGFEKEITVQINLKDFGRAVDYYNFRTTK